MLSTSTTEGMFAKIVSMRERASALLEDSKEREQLLIDVNSLHLQWLQIERRKELLNQYPQTFEQLRKSVKEIETDIVNFTNELALEEEMLISHETPREATQEVGAIMDEFISPDPPTRPPTPSLTDREGGGEMMSFTSDSTEREWEITDEI